METIKLPAEIWQRGGIWTFAYKSTSKIAYATIDPDHVLPDTDPENNSLSGTAMAPGITAASVIKAYIQAIGGDQRLKDVKDLTTNSEGVFQGFTLIRVNKFKMPNKFFQEITVPAYNNFSASHIANRR